jgi:hypothetical protein
VFDDEEELISCRWIELGVPKWERLWSRADRFGGQEGEAREGLIRMMMWRIREKLEEVVTIDRV